MFAQVNERRAFSLRLTIPERGLWTGDAKLDTGDEFAATTVTVTLADLALTGFVFRAGSYSGTTWLRMVGGRGGWYQEIGSKFYRNPFGLRLSPIIRDAASAVGESVEFESDPTIGTFYTRALGPAVRVLNQLATMWFVRPDGVTYIGARTATTIASDFAVSEEQDLARGAVSIATEFPGQWVPGCTFSSPTIASARASTVMHTLEGDQLRTDVWTG